MPNRLFDNKLNILAAFLGCWALQLALGITVRNPLTVVFFVMLLLLGNLWDTKGKQRPKYGTILCLVLSGAIAVALSIMLYERVASGFNSSVFKAISIAVLFLGFFSIALLATGTLPTHHTREKTVVQEQESKKPTILILKVMAICLICWLPYFLYEFPGIMTADSLVQYDQIYGTEPVSNHHPIVHTLLIKIFTGLGLWLTGNKSISIAFYTVFQMFFMAFCCGVSICHIKEKRLRIFAACFYALVPFNGVFVVTIWKDVIFAGVTILLVCKVIDLKDSDKAGIVDWILFTIYSVFFALLRSNAWYAFIVWIPFFLYSFRAQIKRGIVFIVVVLLSVILIKGPVMNHYGIIQPDFVESLSIPAQMIARMLVEEAEISEDDYKLITDVIDTTYIHELYAPDFADNIKELIRSGHPDVLESNKAAYLGLWMRMVAKHPIISEKAWFDLVGGYIYPDVNYPVGNIDGVMSNSYGLEWMPIIGGKLVVKGKEILIKLGSFVPLYGMLWSIGTYTWLLVITIIISIINHKEFINELLLLILVGTLLIAAPLVDFRYGYAIVMTMPMWIQGLCGIIVRG